MTPVPYDFVQTLCHLYVDCGMTAEEIGRRVHRSSATVFYHLKNAGVKMRPRGTGSYKTLAQMTAARNELKEMDETAAV